MKLLGMCVAMAMVAGVAAGPHVARAQALGEAATLSAGVSSAGSASARGLGDTIGRAMGSEGSRMASSSKTSTSGGVINLHWSRADMERSQRAARSRAQSKTTTGSNRPQQDFVIYGADPLKADPDANQDAAPAPQPKPTTPKAPNGKDSGRK